jgi:hypothetical protein
LRELAGEHVELIVDRMVPPLDVPQTGPLVERVPLDAIRFGARVLQRIIETC